MTSEIVNINRYAHGFLKKNIFSRRRINPLIIKWNSLSYNYDGCHKADKNQEAYDIAYELYILSQLDTFIKAPHPAIALAFLGEQAYKLKKVNLAHKHLEAAKVHIRKYLHIDPIFYCSLLIEIGDIEACSLEIREANKTYEETLKYFTSFSLKETEDYLFLLEFLIETCFLMGDYAKTDLYMDELKNIKIPFWEKYKKENNFGDIYDYNLLAYLRYSYSLLARGLDKEAKEILTQIELFLEPVMGQDDLKNEVHTRLLELKAKHGKNNSLDLESSPYIESLSNNEKCKSLGEKAMIYYHQNDFNKAISLLKYAIESWDNVEIYDSMQKYKFLANLAYIYYKIGDTNNAKKYFVQSLEYRLSSYLQLIREKSQDNKFIFSLIGFGRQTVINEFIITEHELYTDLRLAFFENQIKIKNILYHDHEYFSKLYKGYFSLVKCLDSDEVYIEIVRTANSEKFGTAYLFFIVTKDTVDYPELVILQNGAELEGKYYRNYINQILDKSFDNVSYKIFWELVEKKIPTKKRIFISPDGIYRTINIETLYNSAAEPLINNKTFYYVNSLEHIINRHAGTTSELNSALLIGNPSYDNMTEHGNNKYTFAPLPETKNEIETIKNIFLKNNVKPIAFVEKLATKENIINNISQNVIHIAAHGFINKIETEENLEKYFQEECLVLSDSDSQSNILNADEIRGLELSNVKLTVLSSCISGVGELASSGVIVGFPLAFFTAGCKNIIISLWEVDDAVTRELMVCFYENFLISNNPIDALKSSKLKIAEKYKHPYFWGGFILISR